MGQVEQGGMTVRALLADTGTSKKCTAERSEDGRGCEVKCAGLVMSGSWVSVFFLASRGIQYIQEV